ncbi:UBX domain containing protein [Acanthamoeba castellanii str. Neff]|uniref:UBX domain containing protein n=1 Tax=Acanthamoeba castellanii (strain ATCC 30010 / Neff) TaxID=1257118 RepID=L8HJZ1_ACACF|nr:UBX domain containing protein [Acanthamoeba castellanii str. Neff]ELR24701.1 UBX domain containing protein [Acanthamoeba castellanii str. Neff]
MELLGLIAGAVSKAREDFNREREAMHNGARLRAAAASVDDGSNLTEDEQMQMALAMSENELLEHERQERELDEEATSFEELIDEGEQLPRNRAMFQFDKILDTSDLRPDELEDVGEMDTQNDELLARQLQEEEDEVDEDASNNDHPAASAPPLLLPPSAPLSILPPPIVGLNPFNPLGAGQQHHHPSWWSPPPAGPLPIVTSSPPLPWLRDPVPPSPGPRPFFGGLTDSQLAREIQAVEDDAILAANEQPAHYRPPAVPEADSSDGGGSANGMDDGLLRAMEESRRDAEEQERRALREQQEQEYQETLLMDQIRESEREEEEKRRRRQEEEQQRRREEEAELREEAVAETAALRFSLELKRDSEIAQLRELVPAEVAAPTNSSSVEAGGRKVCALVIRLANGSRLERRFWGDNTLRDVKHFVDLRLLEAAKQEDEAADRVQRMKKKEKEKVIGGPDSKGEESQSEEVEQGDGEEREEQLRPERYLPPNYSLATTYPQKKFTNWDATLEEAGLCPRAVVCVLDS